MSQDTTASDVPAGIAPEPGPWVQWLPDGAVSVESHGKTLVLRASQKLQRRFEELLERRKAATLTPEEDREYQAICELDDALSSLNRLRAVRSRGPNDMVVTTATRRVVRERASGRCEYCHADERWQFVRFTIDHVVPRSAGGGDDDDNLALACRNCNERRSNRCEAADPETNRSTTLFNPRQDRWSEHFTWDAEGIRVVGLTPTGRATARLLDFNDDRHDGRVLQVRQRDVHDGYHPPPGDPVQPRES